MTQNELGKLLSNINERKIVSVAVPISNKNIAYTYTKCESTYNTIISHLIEKHNCNRIACVTGLLTNSSEAMERFEAYKTALQNNHLPYDEKLVTHSDFTHRSAFKLYSEKYPTKESVDFDAIVCANDMTAYGCIDALKQIDIKIPEDVKVFGYDDIEKSRNLSPTLSTVNQQLAKQGLEAGKIALQIANGEKVSAATQTQLEPCYRESCGCTYSPSKNDTKTTDKNTVIEILSTNLFQSKVNYLLDLMNDTVTLDSIYKKIDELFGITDFTSISIYLFDEPIIIKQGDEYILPNRVQLSGFGEKGKNYGQSCSYTTNPNNEAFINDVLSEKNGIYLFHPIYNGTKLFGYLTCKINTKNIYQSHILLKIFSHGTSLAYEYTKSKEKNMSLSIQNELLQIKNTQLDQKNRTDELTKILNRRGIIEMGQKLIDFSLEINQKGLVFFGDMNGLKFINDTYGHEMGDIAIKAQAEVFKSVFRSSDIIGRLSGDEFVAIVPGLQLKQIDFVYEKVYKKTKQVAVEYNLPFQFSISIGAVEFNSENYNLEQLIKDADSKQYIEKRKFHNSRLNSSART